MVLHVRQSCRMCYFYLVSGVAFTADKYIITKNNTLTHGGEGSWIKKSHFKLQQQQKKSKVGKENIREAFKRWHEFSQLNVDRINVDYTKKVGTEPNKA